MSNREVCGSPRSIVLALLAALAWAGSAASVSAQPGRQPATGAIEDAEKPAAEATKKALFRTGMAFRVGSRVFTWRDVRDDIGSGYSSMSASDRESAEVSTMVALMRDEIADQAIRALGLRPPESIIRDRIERQMKAFASPAEFRSALMQRGLTEEENRRLVAREWSRAYYRRARAGAASLGTAVRGRATLEPTISEVRAEYLSRLEEEFTVPASATLRVISVSSGRYELEGFEARKAAALAEAEAIRSSILGGAPMAPLADRFNPEIYREQHPGGLMEGVQEKTRLPAEVLAFAFEASAGQLSEVLQPERSRRSVWLVRVESREPARVKPFTEVQATIGDQIWTRRFERAQILDEINLLKKAYVQPARLKELLLADRRAKLATLGR